MFRENNLSLQLAVREKCKGTISNNDRTRKSVNLLLPKMKMGRIISLEFLCSTTPVRKKFERI